MENKVNEDLRQVVSAIRRHGSEFNMSLPIDRLRSEALKLKIYLDQLLSIVGKE